MRVPRRRLHLCVPEQLADHRQPLTRCDCGRRERVPQVVDVDVLQAGARSDSLPEGLQVREPAAGSIKVSPPSMVRIQYRSQAQRERACRKGQQRKSSTPGGQRYSQLETPTYSIFASARLYVHQRIASRLQRQAPFGIAQADGQPITVNCDVNEPTRIGSTGNPSPPSPRKETTAVENACWTPSGTAVLRFGTAREHRNARTDLVEQMRMARPQALTGLLTPISAYCAPLLTPISACCAPLLTPISAHCAPLLTPPPTLRAPQPPPPPALHAPLTPLCGGRVIGRRGGLWGSRWGRLLGLGL